MKKKNYNEKLINYSNNKKMIKRKLKKNNYNWKIKLKSKLESLSLKKLNMRIQLKHLVHLIKFINN